MASSSTPLSSSYSSSSYSSSVVTVSSCNLNQWALDFTGNVERILESCSIARRRGASYRVGPELEICGYGCEDHFYEQDTLDHCWESLVELLERGATDGNLLCDFGMPVMHRGVRYNCRVLVQNRRILLVRPKTSMADNGNYRESRYFTPYRSNGNDNEKLLLPEIFQEKFGRRSCPFGTRSLSFGNGVSVGCESCEELWTPAAPHIDQALHGGVEIIGNGSASHHELRKLGTRLELIVSATRKCGGVYCYANQRGCDGSGRLYYDGGALIVCNGRVLARASQFSLRDVEVITATVDLDDVRSYRASIPSFGVQAIQHQQSQHQQDSCMYSGIDCCEYRFGSGDGDCDGGGWHNQKQTKSAGRRPVPTPALELPLPVHIPEEECCLGPACWLWDYLRRSGASGFLLPLSGGADSSSVATIVGAMCRMVTEEAQRDPTGPVATDCRKVCGRSNSSGATEDSEDTTLWVPSSSKEMASLVLHTIFMGTEHSSENTTSRARRLADAVGSYHLSIKIDTIVAAVVSVFQLATGKVPRFSLHGGTAREDLALQNIQARLRMVLAYLMAQLLPWTRSRSGFLLVLGSANVDEGLRGYMTKYDCSSADLNPIGAVSKRDLKKMLSWAARTYDWPVLDEIAGAPPTAELRPIISDNGGKGNGNGGSAGAMTTTGEHSQLDEEEMGMTYEELGYFGTLRKISRCGPVSMFRKLCVLWNHLPAKQVAEKVKRFFYYYAVNRHKMCTITPSYHAEAYSPDDHRFDLRPFLYNTKWTRQFAAMDRMVAEAQEGGGEQEAWTTTADSINGGPNTSGNMTTGDVMTGGEPLN